MNFAFWTFFAGKPLFTFYVAAINVITFIMFGTDKRRAVRRRHRIRVSNLMLLAVLGGSLGAWAGMYSFRHKTNRLIFVLGIPLILLSQILMLILLVNM